MFATVPGGDFEGIKGNTFSRSLIRSLEEEGYIGIVEVRDAPILTTISKHGWCEVFKIMTYDTINDARTIACAFHVTQRKGREMCYTFPREE